MRWLARAVPPLKATNSASNAMTVDGCFKRFTVSPYSRFKITFN
jgi:hypothetical protein